MKKILMGLLLACAGMGAEEATSLVFEPPGGGNGKHVVLISGDEEYRSEESCPMLGKILSQRHGFKATVLFAINPEEGYIDPNFQENIPGLEALADADLMIIGARFRRLPDEQLQPILDYLNAGKPVMGFRTATHAFKMGWESDFGGFAWKDFGKLILGEGWAGHHGKHKVEGALAKVEEGNAEHPILNEVSRIFVPSDVYGVKAVTAENATILLRGLVTETLERGSKLVEKKNKPGQPMAWLKKYERPNGEGQGTAFATTMGASVDFLEEDLRRLMVNAAYYLTGLSVPEKADVTYVDEYEPTFYGFNRSKDYYRKRNLRVKDFRLGSSASTGVEGKVPKLWKRETSKVGKGLRPGERIVMVGNGLGEGFLRHPHFETELQTRFVGKDAVVRNLCHPGYTPIFRPHAARNSQWAFDGVEHLRPEFAIHKGTGHYPRPDEWLTMLKAETILGFFGYNESFDGEEGLPAFEAELQAFVDHTLKQDYSGKGSPRLVLVSPIFFESKSEGGLTEEERQKNENLKIYAAVMEQVAARNGVEFVDLYESSRKMAAELEGDFTNNGFLPNDDGYRLIGRYLVEKIYGSGEESGEADYGEVLAAALEKNWYWKNDYQLPNGVHAYGRRHRPYGNINYPAEIKKNREMTENRDRLIWATAKGEEFDLEAADAQTTALEPIETNFLPGKKTGSTSYLYGEDAEASMEVPEGYEVNLFASEERFPNLANPVQLSFDGEGRLWVSVLPSYPHYRPGDERPNDKILIYEDTDGDGRADKETLFADGLDLPFGFELVPGGVIVAQCPTLVFLSDEDGDGRADKKEVLLSGFDHHDTHHAIGAFCSDPAGGIIMCEGLFLHSNVETADGPVRGVNGGFYRYDPRSGELERTAQLQIPNPWGVAFDQWGQDFFLYTSGSKIEWMMPGSLSTKEAYGMTVPRGQSLVPDGHSVRPTSGLEFLSSRHFPDEVQGDMLVGNTIGFRGIKQHAIEDSGTGYETAHRQDLLFSNDGNFRPCDMEVAPDGSLYVVDWHNVLIGHMQHSARDPLRDHKHGRIYRVTYPGRPLLKPAKIAGASVEELLENLKLPEYRARYRTRRELRGREQAEVDAALTKWLSEIDREEEESERWRLEGLWVSWGNGKLNRGLLEELLESPDFHVRAAAVRVVRYHLDELSHAVELLKKAAVDGHGRVRLEAIVAATWLPREKGMEVLEVAADQETDVWSRKTLETALARVSGKEQEAQEEQVKVPNWLRKRERKYYVKGHEVFNRDGYCATCHRVTGRGFTESGFPPLAGTEWVNGDKVRLVKLTLHGLMGPLELNNGMKFPGKVPMMGFGGMLDDEELASVLTYVRNSFGNRSSAVTPEEVAKVREATKDRNTFYQVSELLGE